MNKQNFSCPKCGTPVPRLKAIYMTNFTKIKCNKCGIKMKPNKKVLFLIGGIGGGVGGGTGALIGSYAAKNGDWIIGGILFLLLLVFIMVVASYFTFKFTDFTEV